MPEERLPSNLILYAEDGVPFAMMQTGKDSFLAVPGETPLGALEALYREKDFLFPASPCPEPVIGVGERILLQLRWSMREDPPARYWAWREDMRGRKLTPPAKGATPVLALAALLGSSS